MLQEDNHLYSSIRSLIEFARGKAIRAVNSILLETYWNIGNLIVDEELNGKSRAIYGQNVLKNVANLLTRDFGKGFDERNLNNMCAFYRAYPIWNAVRTELSWTHYRILSRVESPDKRIYYTNEAIVSGWNTRVLERNISSLAFDRTLLDPTTKNKLSPENFIKDPYIFEFLGNDLKLNLSERKLETALIDHLQQFLLELGKGFAFVARQQHIVTDTSDFFIDLVFYNYYLKCFVLIDLKTTKLRHQDIGQMDMYVRMYEDLKKGEGDNPTIGIILCTEKDETIVKYSVLKENKQLFASKYILYLPKEEELKEIIENNRQLFELNKDQR